MQKGVQQPILSTEAVMAPERLNAQQIHCQNLPDDPFVRGANGVGGVGLPQ